MRLATAADEILPLRDPRVQQNEAYLAVIVLARVITRLGSLPTIDTGVIEGLYASDLAYLQRLYERVQRGDDDEPEPVAGRLAAPAARRAAEGSAPWGKHEGLSRRSRCTRRWPSSRITSTGRTASSCGSSIASGGAGAGRSRRSTARSTARRRIRSSV